jgi:hypothetical protein
MSVYAVLIFVHVLGAVGMFTASGIEGMTLARLYPGPDSPDSEGAARGLVRARRAAMLAMLATIATGIWMMRIAWTPQPWQQAAMAAMAALVVVGAVLRRRATVGRAGGITARGIRVLRTSLRLRVALGDAILALMTMKPGVEGSWSIVVAGATTGAFWVGASRRGRAKLSTIDGASGR